MGNRTHSASHTPHPSLLTGHSLLQVTQDYDRLYGVFGYGLQVELLWNGPSNNASFTLKNVGYETSCISKAFAAVDGILATFSNPDAAKDGHYKYLKFPGFTWRKIVYTWVEKQP